MTDEQYRELRQLILDVGLQVAKLRMELHARQKLDDNRWSLLQGALFEELPEEIDIPEDIRKLLGKS